MAIYALVCSCQLLSICCSVYLQPQTESGRCVQYAQMVWRGLNSNGMTLQSIAHVESFHLQSCSEVMSCKVDTMASFSLRRSCSAPSGTQIPRCWATRKFWNWNSYNCTACLVCWMLHILDLRKDTKSCQAEAASSRWLRCVQRVSRASTVGSGSKLRKPNIWYQESARSKKTDGATTRSILKVSQDYSHFLSFVVLKLSFVDKFLRTFKQNIGSSLKQKNQRHKRKRQTAKNLMGCEKGRKRNNQKHRRLPKKETSTRGEIK